MSYTARLERSHRIFEAATGRPANCTMERVDIAIQSAWLEIIETELKAHGGIDLKDVSNGLAKGFAGILHGLILSEEQLSGKDKGTLLRSVYGDMLREIADDISRPPPDEQIIKAGPVMSAPSSHREG